VQCNQRGRGISELVIILYKPRSCTSPLVSCLLTIATCPALAFYIDCEMFSQLGRWVLNACAQSMHTYILSYSFGWNMHTYTLSYSLGWNMYILYMGPPHCVRRSWQHNSPRIEILDWMSAWQIRRGFSKTCTVLFFLRAWYSYLTTD